MQEDGHKRSGEMVEPLTNAEKRWIKRYLISGLAFLHLGTFVLF